MVEIDRDVVVRAQAGDEGACRFLLETLHRPVLAAIRRVLGPWYRQQVEDIAQEVFLRVFRSIDRFDVDRGVRFSTWVFSIARNYCYDVTRRPRLDARTLSLRDGSTRDVPDPSTLRAMQDVEGVELGRVIAEAVSKLSDDYRIAFVLREYEGLPYRDIAHAVGTNVGTVKTRLHRARKALRLRLTPYVCAAG